MDIDCLLIVNLDKQELSSYSRLKRPQKLNWRSIAFIYIWKQGATIDIDLD